MRCLSSTGLRTALQVWRMLSNEVCVALQSPSIRRWVGSFAQNHRVPSNLRLSAVKPARALSEAARLRLCSSRPLELADRRQHPKEHRLDYWMSRLWSKCEILLPLALLFQLLTCGEQKVKTSAIPSALCGSVHQGPWGNTTATLMTPWNSACETVGLARGPQEPGKVVYGSKGTRRAQIADRPRCN